MRFIALFLAFYCFFFVQTRICAQEIEYSPKEYIAEDGTIYWNKSLPVYLRISPYPDGQGHLLKGKAPTHSNPVYLDAEGVNYIRTKYAVDNVTKRRISPREEVMLPIIADGRGPQSAISYQNAFGSSRRGTRYFGAGLTIELSSFDKLSGVDMLMFSVDEGPLTFYSEGIEFPTQGAHRIKYYAVDNVGNKENTKVNDFVVDLTSPDISHNVNGIAEGNVIASSSTIYFTATDELSGVDHVYYRFDNEQYKEYNGSNVAFQYLSDGEHTLYYHAVDRVGNRTSDFVATFYLDKTAPLTASDILGDRFVVDNKVYFSGRTKMKLTAVDNKIGVKEIRYSINNSKDFQIYDQPFYLPSRPGSHTIRYYSMDRLANRPTGSESYKHNISLVYLDLSGPSIRSVVSGPSFTAGGVKYISPNTRIKLVGYDEGSGLQYMAYSLNGQPAEQVYQTPITIQVTGKHDIEMFAYDNVNNRNIGVTSVFVDASPPEIYANYSTRSVTIQDGLDIYPSYVTIFLAATDDIVGNDKIYYSINGGSEKLFEEPLSAWQKNKTYNISVKAIDKVGNVARTNISFKTAPN